MPFLFTIYYLFLKYLFLFLLIPSSLSAPIFLIHRLGLCWCHVSEFPLLVKGRLRLKDLYSNMGVFCQVLLLNSAMVGLWSTGGGMWEEEGQRIEPGG